MAIEAKDEEIVKLQNERDDAIDKLKEYLSYPQVFLGTKGSVFKSSIKVISFNKLVII